MKTTLLPRFILPAALAVLMSCGAAEDSKGERPTDQQLCQLKIGLSTPSQAIVALGEPTIPYRPSGFMMWTYVKISEKNVKAEERVTLFFVDASNGPKLFNIQISGREFPQCAREPIPWARRASPVRNVAASV